MDQKKKFILPGMKKLNHFVNHRKKKHFENKLNSYK